ncbi:hypothetical protein, partial [Brachybacterium hainanense]
LDAGMFANTPEQYQKLGDATDGPKFGIAYGYSAAHFSGAVDYANPDSASMIMTPLAPMAGPSGVRTCQWDHFSYGYPNFVITPKCEDPVQMIRWADHQFHHDHLPRRRGAGNGVGLGHRGHARPAREAGHLPGARAG